MKKTILFIFGLSCAILAWSQEPRTTDLTVSPRVHEIGLVTYGLSSLGLTYRWGKDNALWRLQTLGINGKAEERTIDSQFLDRKSVEFSLGIGREYRKNLKDKFQLRAGAELGIQGDFSFEDYGVFAYETTSLGAYASGILGFCYTFKGRFVLGAEMTPTLTYRHGIFNSSNTVGQPSIPQDWDELRLHAISIAAISFCLRF